MIKSYRIRRILAPTFGLAKAAVILLLGLTLTIVGGGLAFKRLLAPAMHLSALWIRSLVGAFVGPSDVDVTLHILALVALVIGIIASYRGFRSGMSHVLETLNPAIKSSKYDVYMRRQLLAQGPRIVAIGGGTGLSTLLRGWKMHTSNITAIVCVSDDGGSSGQLVREKGMIPPGDIRNCLVALADAEKAMTDLFQHRFKNDSGSLSGHSMGNLLIAALVDQTKGDFERAIETASDVLNIRGRVIPATLAHVRLRATLDDGQEICGETAIVEARGNINRMMIDPADCSPTKEAIEAIMAADMVCIGPGSVFTSIIPNLLVKGIAQALQESPAQKVYICNVMTQPGESDSFSASQHAEAILRNVDRRIFDYVMVNTTHPSATAMERYRDSDQFFVEPDIDRIRSMGYRVIQGEFISETDVVRHDPMKVVARLMRMVTR